MAQEVVKAFKEVVDRLKDANVEGQLLERVELMEGPLEESIGDKNLPVVIYELLSIRMIDVCFPAGVRASLTVLITVVTDAACGYYNDERAGIIDLYEKIQDVINGSPTLDLAGSGNWGPTTPEFRTGGFERDGLANNYLIEIDIESNRFTKGSLQS